MTGSGLPLDKRKSTRIWAIGGGKGGTGKSFLISNIAYCLARQGHRVTLLDGDLGGANLHSFLGVGRPTISLTEFFENGRPLCDLVVETGIPNLGLLTGSVGSLASDGIKYTQKLKFFRHISALEADYVLIDLGAGANLNTMDTFLLADKMLLGIVPEITSVENLYHYLKNVFFRALSRSLDATGHRGLVWETWKNRRQRQLATIGDLVRCLKDHSESVCRAVEQATERLQAHIIVNQVRNRQEITLGHSVRSILRKYFDIESVYAGYVEYDDFVSRCINKRQMFARTYPDTRTTMQIAHLADNLLCGKAVRWKDG